MSDTTSSYQPLKPGAEGLDPAPWTRAQAECAVLLAEAAAAGARLDAALLALPGDARAGAIRRLALVEVEALLWAQGMPMRREEIGKDLLDARAETDLEAMRLARWATRRLDGQGGLTDLRGFLGLHRIGAGAGLPDAVGEMTGRPSGAGFDAAAAAFRAALEGLAMLHPLARAPAAMLLWRLAGLSPPGLMVERAVWAARAMAAGCEALPFLPLGRAGRQVREPGGAPAGQIARHLRAVTEGAEEARQLLSRLGAWRMGALEATEKIKGDTAARVIAALIAHPLLSAPEAEAAADISRITAERMLNRMTGMGLIREVTGAGRFRLWTAVA
ncbi:helix-turn-helix domain-containing protein [Paracoccus marinaquae]|uniref:HTH DNA binding domain-containing protein n=1 Tax=Paracoccus marinaquae TaxID=2841926 RepID=A0ABS6AQB5_9RHOB|nr:helix-turn-helix domain-containing protein [Paracoccus marinaquae]MBU3032047.1 hypothetical protein [Paracoccus marinaquae]